tara:strand:- start:142 stop:564 length:423 start_codon:yes stop_codon:yes gene_type:complete
MVTSNEEIDMKFAIYQIQLTSAQRNTINESGDFDSVPAFAAKTKMTMDFSGNKIGGLASDAFDAGYYTHVANIEATDYNDCFKVGNIGPDRTDGAVSSVERLGKMSSLSVGDVIVAEDGTVVVIAPIGFVAFSHNPKVAA